MAQSPGLTAKTFAQIPYMKNPNRCFFKAETNIVLLEPDVAKVFKTPTSVNQALRSLAQIIKAQKQKA